MAGMTSAQLDHLDGIVADVRNGDDTRWPVLSTGEKLYVALAGNSMLLLQEIEYSIPEALAGLGTSDIINLIERWQYRG